MKHISKLFPLGAALLAMTLSLNSCFKDEPLNAEADIEKAYINVENPEQIFFNATDASIDVLSSENRIVFNVRQSADISAIAVNFDITDGATITPASGSVHDFGAEDVIYTVTSQDGKWTREYTVHFNRVTHTVTDVLNYDFEHYELYTSGKSSYYIWYNETDDGNKTYDWASGNAGYAISWSNATPEEYPTISINGGVNGRCVKLTTRSTGGLGKAVKMPIAAGNLFLGRFDPLKAMVSIKDAMQATMFGIPFDRKPIRVTGYYKYKPGEVFIDKNFKEHPDRTDSGDIYAVLFKNHDSEGNSIVLYGDNVLTSSQIVGLARIEKTETTQQWTPFDIDFNYFEEIDDNLLANRGYSFTLVFSSSINGASFEGAIGSELIIDDVKVYTEQIEN